MINERRYILIDFASFVPEMLNSTIQKDINRLRHVKLPNDNTDYVVLKWRGDKPVELWSEYPVYSNEEMIDILEDDELSKMDAETYQKITA